jgi:hypothetical protein
LIINKFGQTFTISDKEIDDKIEELDYHKVREDYTKRTELRSVVFDVYRSVEEFRDEAGQDSVDFLLHYQDMYDNVRRAVVTDLAMQKANIRYDA